MSEGSIPLVSIIMCTNNRAHYILETINSIRNQTYGNWELFIMDNASTDNTSELVAGLKDDRIHYMYFQHSNTGTLRNKGFQLAKGELIGLMDSDDLWENEKLEKQVDALLQNPDAGYSFTNAVDFRSNFEFGSPYNDITEGVSYKNVFQQLCLITIKVPIQSLLFWKKNLAISGVFGETRLFNDFKFLGDISYHFVAAIIHKPLLLRRLHDNNSVDTQGLCLSEEYVEAMNSFIKKKRLSYRSVSGLLFNAHISIGEQYAREKSLTGAYNNYIHAWYHRKGSIVPLKKIVKSTFQIFFAK